MTVVREFIDMLNEMSANGYGYPAGIIALVVGVFFIYVPVHVVCHIIWNGLKRR